MEDKTKSINFTSESLGLVVFVDRQSRFKNTWLYLFRGEMRAALAFLSPLARATLLDAIILGNISPEGLICLPTQALYGLQVGRATRFRAISTLEKFNLVRRRDGLLYVSPRLVYRGKSKDWVEALQFWFTLLEKGGNDDK
jgi:hypothetical protein